MTAQEHEGQCVSDGVYRTGQQTKLLVDLRMDIDTFKRKHKLHYFIFLAYLPGMLAISLIFGDDYIFYAFFLWVAAWLWNMLTIFKQECPFCGEKYFKVFLGYNVWAFKCSSCKKSIYKPDG